LIKPSGLLPAGSGVSVLDEYGRKGGQRGVDFGWIEGCGVEPVGGVEA
jgi:hypothetical protein